MINIAILLATYNGSERLKVLLDSILNQTFCAWTLYIRDDGSTDDTVAICNKYAEEHNNIFIKEDETKHRGAMGSFIWLLENVEADYYMFCDQDDLWLPNKILQSFEFLKGIEIENPNVPICIHTDLAVSDGYYNVISKSLWKQSRIKPSYLENIDYIQVFNCVTGCSMMFNHKAMECAFPFNDISPMHDFWIVYQTLAHGGILSHLHASTILYCQHGDNEVGANNVGVRYIIDKIKKLPHIIKENKEKYKVMHEISGISFYRYMKCKLIYEIVRLV